MRVDAPALVDVFLAHAAIGDLQRVGLDMQLRAQIIGRASGRWASTMGLSCQKILNTRLRASPSAQSPLKNWRRLIHLVIVR